MEGFSGILVGAKESGDWWEPLVDNWIYLPGAHGQRLNLSQEKIERGFAVLERLQLLTRLPLEVLGSGCNSRDTVPQ